MTGKELNLGQSDFRHLMQNNNYFVDKSLFIKEVIDAQVAVLLLPRPRRFGKTLNLSMLRYFFDARQPENKDLFPGLKIWKEDNKYKQRQGKHPVIFLSFKDAKEELWDDCYELIISEISVLYGDYSELLESDILSEIEKKTFRKIIDKEASKVDYQKSIKSLCRYLNRYYQEDVVILIDEYDTPIHSGYNNGFYKQVTAFMRNLLSGAFKDNNVLYKGVITGILRVSRESIFSGLNNISVFGILESRFSDSFGFTEVEVKQVLSDFEIETDYSLIKQWYDGYNFGTARNLYNPWSVLKYITEHNDGFRTYWANTSSNELVRQQITNKNAVGIREDILKLLNGENIEKSLEENFVFPDLNSRESLLWTLFTYGGYLTTKRKISLNEYELCIPNYEIKTIFKSTILEWFETDIKIVKTKLEQTAKHLVNNQLHDFENGFRQIMGDTFSYYDTVKNHEYVYHSYILGLLAIIGDDYIIKSNRESGEGRYDIILIPHDKTKNGVVIEIKQIEKQKDKETGNDYTNRINNALTEAKNQIERNKYYNELFDYGLNNNQIVKVPVVFAGKEQYVNILKK